jgi:alkylation response protein AidB-like acyl-CoA dehydrogenase
MDFKDSPEEAQFRAKARAWLSEHAPRGLGRSAANAELVTATKAWQARKAEAGYACISWAAPWGPGGSAMEAAIFFDEEQAAGVTDRCLTIGLGMCLPTVMAVGDEATKARFLPAGRRGDDVWCQLFSEPAGGSDVAAARTRAVRDGDEWVVDGQKVWTSVAQYADYGLLLARTDPDVAKHKGLTMFWVDMKAPGVEVRPIHQISGGSEFNEVFFTGVRLKDSQRLGGVGEGWRVSIVTLMNERVVGGANYGPGWADVLRLAQELPTAEGPAFQNDAVRHAIADFYIQAQGLKLTRLRAMTALSRGQTPGPENSIGKLAAANLLQDMATLALTLEDAYGVIDDPDFVLAGGEFQRAVFSAPAQRLAGGSDEILKNVLAERVLGLPGEPRLDKDRPFRELDRPAPGRG